MSNLIRSRKSRVSAVLATAAVSLGLVASPAAMAQNANAQEGLVNVNLQTGDIAVPVSVAAGICGVSVNVLAADFQQDGSAECNADSDNTVTQGRGNGPNGNGPPA